MREGGSSPRARDALCVSGRARGGRDALAISYSTPHTRSAQAPVLCVRLYMFIVMWPTRTRVHGGVALQRSGTRLPSIVAVDKHAGENRSESRSVGGYGHDVYLGERVCE